MSASAVTGVAVRRRTGALGVTATPAVIDAPVIVTSRLPVVGPRCGNSPVAAGGSTGGGAGGWMVSGTGSVFTAISPGPAAVGYSFAIWPRRQFVSATGPAASPAVTLVELEALGHRCSRRWLTRSPLWGSYWLLGLDFLRAFNFSLRFRDGVLSLE